ncbi:NT-type C2 domain-containing protein [Dioscorea alata]|uniref:NT-type C2 domain-containing protein n=1 Tax=Dioscorea alata TaxID=55571 RepID=A0ACB7V7R4_DIOAL|nr:NT-type C2 domain-containing protein [Dioscorea alata]
MVDRKDSNTQLLQELESLSQSLYPPRRTASLALQPSSVSAAPVTDEPRPRSRRLSMSPFRSRPNNLSQSTPTPTAPTTKELQPASSSEKKKLWNWKPIRALSHIGMRRLNCLLSVEVVSVQGLPASMNGLRLSVTVRKKESKDSAIQTMPARVLQGAADFEEMLFIRCHVYCSGGSSSGKPLKFEPRPFLISVTAIDAPELDFGRSSVDLSDLVKESMDRSLEGSRVRQWDTTFSLAGKAKGGELVLKLGFQIMEDGGVGIYSQPSSKDSSSSSSSLARRQSKSSFSVTSPKITRSEPSTTPSKNSQRIDLKGIDDFSLDEPGPPSSLSPETTHKSELEVKVDDLDLPEFEVVDKGIEIQDAQPVVENEVAGEESSVSSEVVKEVVVQDSAHLMRLTELDEIAKQIKALELVIGDGYESVKASVSEEDEMQRLDAEEETVTREFLQLLELEGGKDELAEAPTPTMSGPESSVGEEDASNLVFLPDLGKSIGSVVQTRDGGYLVAINPLDVIMPKKEIPKLAMQISKPLVLGDENQANGFEVFQRLASLGSEGLASQLMSLLAMDELMGKTAEQIAFEGIASAIISGRNKEVASSSAAKSMAVLKLMSTALSQGRKERIKSGIWNVKEEPVTMEEVLALALQKIEAMSIDALKIQADMPDEAAPFHVSLATGMNNPLDTATPVEEWLKNSNAGKTSSVSLMVVVQLRDPLRRYEAVGAPVMAVLQAALIDEEEKFKMTSLHVGSVKVRTGGRRSVWDGEKQRLTAMQWLVAYGLVKAGRKGMVTAGKGGNRGQDFLWSLSSRIMADMWLKPMRNPDVKMNEK